MGHFHWKEAELVPQKRAVEAMVKNEFTFMGANASYAKFFEGYGYAGTLALLLAAVLFWIYSSSGGNRPSIISVGIFLVFWALMEQLYFFPLAAGMTIVAAILCLAAGLRTKSV